MDQEEEALDYMLVITMRSGICHPFNYRTRGEVDRALEKLFSKISEGSDKMLTPMDENHTFWLRLGEIESVHKAVSGETARMFKIQGYEKPEATEEKIGGYI